MNKYSYVYYMHEGRKKQEKSFCFLDNCYNENKDEKVIGIMA